MDDAQINTNDSTMLLMVFFRIELSRFCSRANHAASASSEAESRLGGGSGIQRLS
jgi:hypothetical protein